MHYRVYSSSPLVLILSQMRPVHNLPPYFPKILSNIFLHLCLGLLSGLHPSGFPPQHVYIIIIRAYPCVLVSHMDILTNFNCTEGYIGSEWRKLHTKEPKLYFGYLRNRSELATTVTHVEDGVCVQV